MSPPPTAARLPRTAEILLKARLIDEMQVKSALRELDKWGGRFTRILNDLKFIPEEKVVEALSHALKLGAVNLDQVPKDQAAMNKIDAETCEEKGIFPCALKDQGKTLWLAMADPTDFETVEGLERKHRVRVKLLVAGEKNIKSAIARHYKGITDERAVNTSGALAAAPGEALELDSGPVTTGEFMDAKGEVVGPMRHLTNPRARMPPPPPSRPQSSVSALAGAVAGAQQSVADELDHLFGMGPSPATWSPEELQRLEAARLNQEKGAKVFRAVIELCVEKGLFTPADVGRIKPP